MTRPPRDDSVSSRTPCPTHADELLLPGWHLLRKPSRMAFALWFIIKQQGHRRVPGWPAVEIQKARRGRDPAPLGRVLCTLILA